MTSSVILRTAAELLQPLLLLLSLYLTWVGHNEPGGGFVGGLVATAAFGLLVFSHGVEGARASLRAGSVRIDPLRLAGVGLAMATVSGLPGVLAGKPYLTALWTELPAALGGIKLGTPLLFDFGVYFLVIGVGASVIFALAEVDESEREQDDDEGAREPAALEGGEG